jgi:hypothetical protein
MEAALATYEQMTAYSRHYFMCLIEGKPGSIEETSYYDAVWKAETMKLSAAAEACCDEVKWMLNYHGAWFGTKLGLVRVLLPLIAKDDAVRTKFEEDFRGMLRDEYQQAMKWFTGVRRVWIWACVRVHNK